MSKPVISVIIFVHVFHFFGIAQKSNYRSERSFARTVFAPNLMPLIPMVSKFEDVDNNEIEINQNHSYRIGGRIERYAPNSKSDFALEFDLSQIHLVFTNNGRYFLSESSIGLTPIITFRNRNLEKANHLFGELGIQSRLLINTDFNYSNNLGVARFLSTDNLKNLRSWVYAGLGIKQDLFNQDWYKVGLGDFRLGVFLPLFNQANLFNNEVGNVGPVELFEKSNSNLTYLTFSYVQYIDLRRNQYFYEIPSEYFYPFQQRLIRPALDYQQPRKNIYGNLYFHGLARPAIDSVIINYGADESFIGAVDPGIGWRLGYTLNIIGNNRGFFGLVSGKSVDGYTKFRPRWSLFTSIGLNISSIQTQTDVFSRYQLQELETSIGLKLGFGSLYLNGGYVLFHDLGSKLILHDALYDVNSFAQRRNEALFFGISLRNSISIRVIVQESKSIRIQERTTDNFYLSFGFGI